MTRLEKHTRTLKDGTQRVYRYAVGADGERHSLSEGTISTACYRSTEKRRTAFKVLTQNIRNEAVKCN
jgi:hypothetical protein